MHVYSRAARHPRIHLVHQRQRAAERLCPRADRNQHRIFISAASLWEIAIKHGLGKLALDRPFDELIPEQLYRQQIETLQIELSHLSELIPLPLHHRDPFDRLIVAQAKAERLPIISVDPALDAYDVQRIW